MADNNDLKVVVGLNLPKSVLEIKKDLVKLADELAGSDDGKLKIVGQLDLGATEKKIKAQLSSLKIDSSALKITPTIDTSSASQLGNQITKQLDTATQKVDFSAIAKNLRKAFNINDNASIKEATENIKAMYEAFNVDPAKYKDAFNKLISWYEQRSNDLVYSERQKVDELNNLLLELYNQPELHTTLPSLGKASKSKPLVVTKSTLEEMKSLLGSMKEVYKLFGSIRVDDKHGALLGFFGEDWDPKEYNDSLGVYIRYLQKIQELRKNNRLQMSDIASPQDNEVFIKMTEQSILNQLGLVNANNKVIQSNEKVAQSERNVAQAQKEVYNAKKNANADKGNDDALKKLLRTDEILHKISKQYELIKYYQEQQKQYKAGTEEWEHYNKAWQEEAKRLELTKQVAKEEGLVTEEYKKQAIELQKRIDEKYAQLNNAKNISNNNGGNYLSNNQIQDIFASLNEAERYFKNFNLGTVTSSLAKGQLQGLKDFVIELKSATGEVEKFRYAVENIGDDQNPQLIYKLTDIKAANAGIQRLVEAQAKLEVKTEGVRAKYTRLLEEFKSSNSAIQTGLTQPIAKFEEVLNGLGTTHSIEDVKNQFESLKTSAAEISKYLDTTNNSFNKTRNAINNYNQMNDVISRIETSYSNLVIKNDELGASVTNLRSLYEALVKTEKEQGGYTTVWAQEYQKVNAVLKEVKTNIEAAVRAESSSKEADKNSQYQIQARHLKSIVEAQRQIVQLSRQRLSADEAESEELARQIKNARQRVRDNSRTLVDKDLYAGVARQIADSTKAMNEQLNLVGAKQTDSIKRNYQDMSSAIDRAVEKLKTLQSQPLFKTEGDSGITKLSTDITTLVRDYEKLQKSMMKSTPNSQNLDHYAEKLVEIDQRTKAIRTTFDTVKGSIAEATKAYSNIERSMSRLDTISGTKIFKDFSSSEEVKQLQDRISQLKKEYQDTFNALKQSDVGSAQFKDALINLDALDAKMKELVVDTKGARDALNNAKGTTAFEKQVASLTNSINNLQKATSLTDNQRNALSGLLNRTALAQDKAMLEQISVELAKLKAEIKQTGTESKNFDQISKSVEKVITDLNAMGRTPIFTTHSNNAGVIEFQDKIKSLSNTAKQVKADLNALGDSKAIPLELKARVDNLIESFKKLEGSNKTLQANLRQNDGWARTERQIQTLTARIKEYMAVNTKAAKKYSGQFDGLLSRLSQAEMNKDSEAVRRLSADFQILRSQIKAAGDQGKTLGQMIVDNAKKFSMWFSLTSNFMRAWRTLKQMVTTVKEIYQAMTSLKKVTNETASSYERFLDNARVQAQKLHSSIVDIVKQTEIWVKLGNDLTTASKLAEVSMIYAKVGDVDNESAVKDLVATMKAFNVESEDAINIVSMLDKLNNEFAVSAKDLGEGLTVTASAMAAGGNSLEKTLSLMTGAGEITQDMQGVANSLRIISMRIRGLNQPLKQLYRLKSRSGQDRGKICSVLYSYAG